MWLDSDPTIIITQSTFANNSSHGLYDDNGTSTVTNNIFTDNTEYGAYIKYPGTSYSGNTGSGNGINGFGVNGRVNKDIVWSVGSSTFPFVLVGTVEVNKGHTLTLSAGTIVKGETSAQLKVYGTLEVNGTSGVPVVFTSLKDDFYGGDTNNDGDATSPSAGDWYGIYLCGYYNWYIVYDGIGNFDWCRIRYGGNNFANVEFYRSDSGHFTNSISEYSANYGVWVDGCSPTFRGNRIENNVRYGIYISSGTPDLGANDPQDKGRNTILNNDSGNYQVYNATSNTINAYYNFWGYITAPEIDAHIRDDEEGGGQVFFDPWLDSDPWEEPTDTIPPSSITNLDVSNPTSDSITLTWTAPGDDGDVGVASQYDIRYSTSPIDEGNWDTATQVVGEPAPKPAVSAESFVVTDLLPGTTYYFAIKTADEVPNWSDLSNVASGTTSLVPQPVSLHVYPVELSNFPQITLIVTTVPASTASQFTADDFTLTENGSLVDIDSAE